MVNVLIRVLLMKFAHIKLNINCTIFASNHQNFAALHLRNGWIVLRKKYILIVISHVMILQMKNVMHWLVKQLNTAMDLAEI